MQDSSVETAIAHLSASDRDTRVAAALFLGKAADPLALDALLQSLIVEPELYVRETITWALVRLGHIAVSPLIHMLSSADASTRHYAVHALGKIGSPEAIGTLVNRLADPDSTVRLKAAVSLGEIGDAKAIPHLIQRFGDHDPAVQSAVNTAVEQFGEAAIDPLIAALQDARWFVRKQSADVLGLIADDRATVALSKMLTDEKVQVRFAVISALFNIGSPNARRAMQTAKDDPDARVRALAARA